MNILIVDDKPEELYLLESILKGSGYEVVSALNGKEALKKLRDNRFNLIISDILMPVMDGFQLCKECKKDEKLKDIPFIFYTGTYMDEKDAELGLKLGADEYLVKPIEPNEMIMIIQGLLKEAKEKKKGPMKPVGDEEKAVLKLYSERLVQKLEKKMLELQKLERRYHTLCENVNDAIFSLGEEGYFTDANCRMEMFGYTPGEAIGKHFTEFLTPKSREIALQYFEKAKKGESSRDIYEVEIVKKDGGIAMAELSMSTIYIDGKFFGRFGVARDITERKRMEEALRKKTEQLKLALQVARMGVWQHNLQSNVITTIQGSGPISGLPEGVYPKTLETLIALVHPEEREMLGQRIQQAVEGEEDFEAEFQVLLPDGLIRSVVALGRCLRDVDGKPLFLTGVDLDITERKQAEKEMAALQDQLHQAQKMEAIGQLAGGFAHDFNNALTLIKASSQLALFDLIEGDPLRKTIEMILGATDRSANLARQLLAFSRRQVMEMKVLDLDYLLRELDKMLRRVIGEDIELVNVLAEDLGRVKADPGQIEQVIMNLALNARDAMPTGGKLTIETANVELDEEYVRTHVDVTPGRYVMLAVTDTGAGMPPEVRERIFEPFFTTKEKGKGTGLGLSSVFGIVKQSGASISVYSEPGRGSTFKIYLPRVEEALEEEKKALKKEISRGGETVLVAEDNNDVRRLAVQILKRQGYRLLEAANGGEAFLICEKYGGEIHLILTDVVMPGMSGRELAERLLLLHPEMKVLYMSGYPDDAVMRHGILEEGTNFIAKPFSLDALVSKVREVLDK